MPACSRDMSYLDGSYEFTSSGSRYILDDAPSGSNRTLTGNAQTGEVGLSTMRTPVPDGFATDVLICGAGAAGLTLAIDLARRGVAFRLIDMAEGPFQGS